MHKRKLFFLLPIFLLIQCKQNSSDNFDDKKSSYSLKSIEKIEVQYSFFDGNKKNIDSFRNTFNPQQFSILLAVNRIDSTHFKTVDTLIIPNNFEAQLTQYSPFPVSLPFLSEVKKIIFFSYSTQSFAVYNSGSLAHWGPTNMGSKKYPTPVGMYYANWKAEETKSTFNDEWILKWNVNLENKEGIGWHQYTMPGFPASHSCLRLLESDAKYLYDWVDEWVLLDEENVLSKGTPVIVFGTYPYGKRKPWMALINNHHSLDISEEILSKEVSPYLKELSKWELKKDSINSVTKN